MPTPRFFWYLGFALAAVLALLHLLLSLGISLGSLIVLDKIVAILLVLEIIWLLAALTSPLVSKRKRGVIAVGIATVILFALLDESVLQSLVPSIRFMQRATTDLILISIILLALFLAASRSLLNDIAGTEQFRRNSRFAVSAFLALALVPLADSLGLATSIRKTWYPTVIDIRGEHLPKTDDIVVISIGENIRNARKVDLIRLLASAEPRMIALFEATMPPGDLKELEATMAVPFLYQGWGNDARDLRSPVGIPTVERGEAYGRFRYEETGLAMYYRPMTRSGIDIGTKIALHVLSPDSLPASPSVEGGSFRAGSRRIPLGEDGKAIVNYYRYSSEMSRWRKYDAFANWYYGELLEDPKSENFLVGGFPSGERASYFVDFKQQTLVKREFRDNAVFIVGEERPSEAPFFRTKILLIGTGDEYSPHPLIYASIVQSILDKDFITEPGNGVVALILILQTLILYVLYLRVNALKAILLSLLLVGVAFGTMIILLVSFSHFVNAFLLFPLIVASPALFFPLAIITDRRASLVETTRLSAELHAAREMQTGLLPREDPTVAGFDIAGGSYPAHEVGGDFYDYVWLDRRRSKLGIAIADVSGKAMKAAMTAVLTSGMIYRELGGNGSPKVILREINKPMFAKIDSRMFTALSFAVIDVRSKVLRFSNAGQSYPLLKRKGKVIPLEVKGIRLPLGIQEDVPYGEIKISLKTEDLLIFYTDGIVDAMNSREEFYGIERFLEFVRSLPHESAQSVRDRIIQEIHRHTGESKQHDDMTVVVVRVL